MADDVIEIHSDEDNPLDFEIADGWPDDVKQAYWKLFSFDLAKLEGRDKHGSLAFTELTPIAGRLRQIAQDLAMESWVDLPSSITDGGLLEQINALNATLDEIADFDLNQLAEPANTKAQLIQRINDVSQWFRNNARPLTVTAQTRREIANTTGTDGAVSEAAVVREELDKLRADNDQISHELEARKDLVKAYREASGESASDDLSAVFKGRADDLGRAALSWLIALAVSGVLAIIGALVTYWEIRPHETGDVSGDDLARIALATFIVGLLVYAVRTCAHQYRANRHLEAVARSKAAALSTFTRFSAAIAEESVRSTVALVLAQAVFATEDTGHVEASVDRVTLMDHALPRITGTSQPTG
jgi:hypothetical protein